MYIYFKFFRISNAVILRDRFTLYCAYISVPVENFKILFNLLNTKPPKPYIFLSSPLESKYFYIKDKNILYKLHRNILYSILIGSVVFNYNYLIFGMGDMSNLQRIFLAWLAITLRLYLDKKYNWINLLKRLIITIFFMFLFIPIIMCIINVVYNIMEFNRLILDLPAIIIGLNYDTLGGENTHIHKSQPHTNQPPIGQPLAIQPPVNHPPVNQPPINQPPVNQPPINQPPVNQPPVNQPPVNQPPINQPPVNQNFVEYNIRIKYYKPSGDFFYVQCEGLPRSLGGFKAGNKFVIEAVYPLSNERLAILWGYLNNRPDGAEFRRDWTEDPSLRQAILEQIMNKDRRLFNKFTTQVTKTTIPRGYNHSKNLFRHNDSYHLVDWSGLYNSARLRELFKPR
jgi:hypothetical protein